MAEPGVTAGKQGVTAEPGQEAGVYAQAVRITAVCFILQGMQKVGNIFESKQALFFLSDTDAGKILLSSFCLCQCYLKQRCNNAAEKKENPCLH